MQYWGTGCQNTINLWNFGSKWHIFLHCGVITWYYEVNSEYLVKGYIIWDVSKLLLQLEFFSYLEKHFCPVVFLRWTSVFSELKKFSPIYLTSLYLWIIHLLVILKIIFKQIFDKEIIKKTLPDKDQGCPSWSRESREVIN